MPRTKTKRPQIEDIDAYLDWLEELPRYDITPEEAAPALGCTYQGLLSGAVKHKGEGTIHFYYAGDCLRVGKMSVLAFCGRYPAQKWKEPKTTT